MKHLLKLFTLLLVVGLALSTTAWGQTNPPWFYDLGTGTGSYSTASGISLTFLPQPPTGGGEDRIRMGTGGGSFNLENPGVVGFGTDTELRIVAPTGTSVNKFSIYDYTAGKTFTIRFEVRFGSGTSGTWSFFNGDGAQYSDNTTFAGAQVFTGLRWVFGASDAIATAYRSGTAWSANITPAPFSQNTNYIVEIYGNNSTIGATYTLNGSQTLAANTFDLWVNDVLVGNDLAKAALPNDVNIDSWMFYGESSTGNVANIYLDNIHYSNKIEEARLPIQLASFVGSYVNANDVTFEWETISEIHNYGFWIQKRAVGSEEFITIDESFQAGRGEPSTYTWTYANAVVDNTEFYLLQQDTDGLTSRFGPIMLNPNSVPNESVPAVFALNQNYPNPFNPATTINWQLAVGGYTTLKVYNILGNEVATLFSGNAEAGKKYVSNFDAKHLSTGLYFYKLQSGNNVEVKKMSLVK